jgi:hypothetical protein
MNISKVIVKSIIIFSIALACFSCSSDRGSSKSTVEESAALRALDVSADNVSITDVESYFSPNRYGPTLKLYNIQDQKTVIKIQISNESDSFEASVVVYVFDRSLEREEIGKWLNNQYSDGIFSDAPIPIGTYKLSEDQYSINSYSLINHTVESYGDEYDNYDIELYVGNVSEDGVYYLNSFISEVVVHVQTKEID